MKKIIKKIANDVADVTLSVTPELSGLLTPETLVDPATATIKVGLAIVGNKLRKFYDEYREKKAEGKIREDIETIQDSLYDILKFIDQGPDEEHLDAVKKLFFISAAPTTPESEQQLVYLLIQTCKKLSSSELLILKASYQLHTNPGKLVSLSIGRNRHTWFKSVADAIGHRLSSLVEASESHLEELKLITGTEVADPRYFYPEGNCRLTDLGYKLCEYLSIDKIRS